MTTFLNLLSLIGSLGLFLFSERCQKAFNYVLSMHEIEKEAEFIAIFDKDLLSP